MTDQTPIVTRPAMQVFHTTDALLPPLAPLVMPTQNLTPEKGMIRRAIGLALGRLAVLRHSFRRIG